MGQCQGDRVGRDQNGATHTLACIKSIILSRAIKQEPTLSGVSGDHRSAVISLYWDAGIVRSFVCLFGCKVSRMLEWNEIIFGVMSFGKYTNIWQI